MDAMETSFGLNSSGLCTPDNLTNQDRDQSEVSSAVVSPRGIAVSEKKQEGEGKVEEHEAEEEEEEEEGEEDLSKWGPLRVPVTLKIADLGNACWVVRE